MSIMDMPPIANRSRVCCGVIEVRVTLTYVL